MLWKSFICLASGIQAGIQPSQSCLRIWTLVAIASLATGISSDAFASKSQRAHIYCSAVDVVNQHIFLSQVFEHSFESATDLSYAQEEFVSGFHAHVNARWQTPYQTAGLTNCFQNDSPLDAQRRRDTEAGRVFMPAGVRYEAVFTRWSPLSK